MKKVLCLFAALLCLFAFAGCQKSEEKQLSGEMQLVLCEGEGAEATVFTVDLKDYTQDSCVMDVIDALAEEKQLCYKGTKGVYGMYLTALGVPQEVSYNGETTLSDSFLLEESLAKKRALYAYTSVEEDKAEGAFVTTVVYGGVTLTESQNGVSKMRLADGAIIYFTYYYWG